MDAALFKTIKTHTPGEDTSPINDQAAVVEANVIKTDAAIFHKTRASRSAPKQSPPPDSDYQAGFEDGQAKAEVTYKKTIKVMQKTLAGLQEELAQITQQIEYNHLSALQKCLETVFPSLLKAGARQELKTLIDQAAQLGTRGKIHLIVHPREKAECQELCEMQHKDFIISTDPTLKPLQVKVLWDDGGAEIDCDAAAKALKRPFEVALETLISHSNMERRNG